MRLHWSTRMVCECILIHKRFPSLGIFLIVYRVSGRPGTIIVLVRFLCLRHAFKTGMVRGIGEELTHPVWPQPLLFFYPMSFLAIVIFLKMDTHRCFTQHSHSSHQCCSKTIRKWYLSLWFLSSVSGIGASDSLPLRPKKKPLHIAAAQCAPVLPHGVS